MLCFSGCKQNNDSELIKTEAVEAQQTAFVEKEGEVLVPESLRTVQLPIVGDSRVIVIDAGHQRRGDSNKEPIGPGASQTKAKVTTGATGIRTGNLESAINLEVELKSQKKLEDSGYQVIMVRTSQDVNISNQQRAEIANKNNGLLGTVEGTLKATIVDGSQCPDIIPVVALAAALGFGTTEVINAGRLRIKECDRLAAVTSELNKLGAKITEKEDGLIIEGVKELKGGVEVWSHKDHRIAMTLAIASTVCNEPIILKDYECVSKSYPQFWEDFKNLGGVFDEWNVGK